MASPTHPVSNTPPAPPAAPSSAHAVTAGAVASANASPTDVNASTKIGSLSDLKRKAPELYQKMIEGIGMKICGEMREHQDRLKKLMREGRE